MDQAIEDLKKNHRDTIVIILMMAVVLAGFCSFAAYTAGIGSVYIQFCESRDLELIIMNEKAYCRIAGDVVVLDPIFPTRRN